MRVVPGPSGLLSIDYSSIVWGAAKCVQYAPESHGWRALGDLLEEDSDSYLGDPTTLVLMLSSSCCTTVWRELDFE